MIFARTHISDGKSDAIESLLGRANLDLLQIEIESVGKVFEGENVGASFLRNGILPCVHTATYLRPELSLAVSVGNRRLIEEVSVVAEYLVSNGSPNLPIAAIRVDDLMAYEDLFKPVGLLTASTRVLETRVEVGGGPFAMAWKEGARIALSNSHDIAAPLIGAAVARELSLWQEPIQLASLAAASHFDNIVAELDAQGSVELELRSVDQLEKVRALGAVAHADVQVDFSNLMLERTARNTFQPAALTSGPQSSLWNAQIIFETGFQATALATGVATRISGLMNLRPSEFQGGSLKCAEYHSPAASGSSTSNLVRIEYVNSSDTICCEFLNWLGNSLRGDEAIGKLIAPPPAVEQLKDMVSVQIAAEELAVSIDTRPAHEWL